jgi:AraC-like DNA-binding protein
LIQSLATALWRVPGRCSGRVERGPVACRDIPDLAVENEVVVPMTYSNGFHRLARSELNHDMRSCTDVVKSVREIVVDKFERMTGETAVVIPLEPGPPIQTGETLPIPRHPICRGATSPQVCKASWRAHREELQDSLEPHWHRCKNENWCAVVPVVSGERCIAVCQLVCDGTQSQRAFECQVETLATLIENFLYRADGRPPNLELPTTEAGNRVNTPDVADAPNSYSRSWHPQVRRAAEIIQKNARDPALSVAAVAKRVGMNSTYLAHLFREQVGIRMRLHIARRRIELAKRFLDTTTWQIKRVAYESGHRNPDWFCQVFRRHTGLTPGAYRRRRAAQHRSRT